MKKRWRDSGLNRSGLMELSPTEINSAIKVESGTVMITSRNVFRTACSGSLCGSHCR